MTYPVQAKENKSLTASTKVPVVDMRHLTFVADDQTFAISALAVKEILKPQPMTQVPLSPPEVLGVMNLRGQIVTVIDLRAKLGLPPIPLQSKAMNIIIEQDRHLYSIQVDKVGDVIELLEKDFEKSPPTLNEQWRDVSQGVCQLQDQLLVVLNIKNLLDLDQDINAKCSTV